MIDSSSSFTDRKIVLGEASSRDWESFSDGDEGRSVCGKGEYWPATTSQSIGRNLVRRPPGAGTKAGQCQVYTRGYAWKPMESILCMFHDLTDKSFDFCSLSTNFIFAVYHAHDYIFIKEEINLTTVTSEDWAKSDMNALSTKHNKSSWTFFRKRMKNWRWDHENLVCRPACNWIPWWYSSWRISYVHLSSEFWDVK